MPHPYELLSESDQYDLTLGQMVTAWALAETQITFLSRILHRFGKGRDYERHAPRAFARKIVLIEKCFQADGRLSALSGLAETFCVAAKLASIERNIIVHGSVIKPFDDLPPVRIRLDQYDWSGAPSEEMMSASQMQIIELITLSCKLAEAAYQLVDGSAQILGVYDRNKPSSEVRS